MRMYRILPALLVIAAFWTLPEAVSAQAPSPCFIPFLPCNGGGSLGLANTIIGMVFSGTAKGIFGAFLTLYFFVYGMRLIILGENESVMQDTKMAYAYGITGCAMYIFADQFLQAFGSQNGTHINTVPVASVLSSVINFINGVIGALLIAIITYQAIRIIVKRGDDSELGAARKRFGFIIGGIIVYSLANMIVAWAMPGTGAQQFVYEIVGVIRYVLEIIGVLSVLSFVFAGFLYIISANEGTTDRAKKAMKNTVIALVVVLFSYVIVSFAANGLRF